MATTADHDDHDDREVDPVEFIKAMLRISPEDVAEVRRIAAERAKREKGESTSGESPG
jgi:hypothetical protein